MKVALICEWLDPWRGGAETSTLQFLHHALDAGIEVHAYTRSRPSPRPGFEVHSIPGAGLSRTRKSITFARRVEARLAGQRYDVIHAITPCRGVTLYQPRGGTVAETLARNLSLRTTRTGRALKSVLVGLNLKQRYLLRIERQLLGSPNGPAVAALSDYVVRQLHQHYGVADCRIHKIFNGVDVPLASATQRHRDRAEIRAQFHLPNDALVVLLVAHNFRLKGVQHWLSAHARLLAAGLTNVHALVVGKGESRAWHRRAEQLGLTQHLTFVGPSDRVAAFRHAADVLVHPTHYDPCSRVVLEAMATGLPCITTRWDGAAEQIVQGRSGFVLPDPADVDRLADHIRDLQAPPRRTDMGKQAARITDAISMARHCREMIELYTTLARTGRGESG